MPGKKKPRTLLEGAKARNEEGSANVDYLWAATSAYRLHPLSIRDDKICSQEAVLTVLNLVCAWPFKYLKDRTYDQDPCDDTSERMEV